MHKFRVTYLGAFIFGWLLAFGSHVAWGYYPPLQATGSYSTNKITYTVFNPQKQLWYTGSLTTTSTVVNMQQHNGVIAWVLLHNNSTYSVGYITFDPGLDTFKRDGWGPFTSVSQLQVMDGVVAYVADIPPSGSDPAHPEFKYATYDPAKGAWQNRSHFPSWPNVSNLKVATQDGVVVVSHTWQLIGYAPQSDLAVDIYNSAIGNWFSAVSGLGPLVIFADNTSTCTYVITNSTIYTTITETISNKVRYETWGYDASEHHWYQGPTKPMAYFVAQPKVGSSPLWVWFTDMSIAGANWSYDFGDGSFLSMNRSGYHIFTSPGSFKVTQWISGPSNYSQTIIVGYPSTLKGKSLPAMLHLLLLAD
jgi:hypothetical protein